MKHTEKFLSEKRLMIGKFVFPGPRDRVTINGMTGSGKTTFALWLFAESADFDKKPWIIVDFKKADFNVHLNLKIFTHLKTTASLPEKPGIYIIQPEARRIDEVVDFLWRVYEKGNIGLFLDEATMIPELRGEANSGGPYQSILSQGRSKGIPVFTLCQRPVNVNKMVYSEANYISVFSLTRRDDWKKITTEIPEDSIDYRKYWEKHSTLEKHHSLWFDKEQNRTFLLRPAPDIEISLDIMEERLEKYEAKKTL